MGQENTTADSSIQAGPNSASLRVPPERPSQPASRIGDSSIQAGPNSASLRVPPERPSQPASRIGDSVAQSESTPWSGELAHERFAEFDDAWLERECSPSSAIGGNYQPYVTGYADRSSAVREALVASSNLGVRYGKAVRNILDVFPAPNTDGSPSPTMIFFHGGYWQESSLRDLSFPAAALNTAGITYISVEYTLAPKATLSDIVEEARQAVRFIVDNAGKLSVDPAHLVIGGHSAGAHLAAQSFDAAVTNDANPGLLLISGIYELLPLMRTTIKDALALTQNEVSALSPLRFPPNCTKSAVIWGDNDTSEFAWQSQRFHEALTLASPGSHQKVQTPQRNHFDLLFDLADRNSELFAMVRQLIGG